MAYANMAIKKHAEIKNTLPREYDQNIFATHIAYIHDTELLYHKSLIV